MNNITIAGKLGKDSEVRYLPNGDPLCSFSVADDFVAQGNKHTIWWNCSLFGKRAESLSQYLTKGQAVTVSGSVTEREWTDKDGNKRKSMDVRVNDVALQGGKREGTTPVKTRDGQVAHIPSGGGDMDDDIPFADPLRSRASCLVM